MYWIKSKKSRNRRNLPPQAIPAREPNWVVRFLTHPATAAWVQAIGAIIALWVAHYVAQLPDRERERRDKQVAVTLYRDGWDALDRLTSSCAIHHPMLRAMDAERLDPVVSDRGWQRLADAEYKLATASQRYRQKLAAVRKILADARHPEADCVSFVRATAEDLRQEVEALRREGFQPY